MGAREVGRCLPPPPQLGADAEIRESPPGESFTKGATHYETGLPACIHYYADYKAEDKLKKLDTKDAATQDGEEAAPADEAEAAPKR